MRKVGKKNVKNIHCNNLKHMPLRQDQSNTQVKFKYLKVLNLEDSR